MATGIRGGGTPSKYGARPATPPGNALMAKEAAAQARVEAGIGPTASPLHAAGSAVHALLHGTQTPAGAAKQAKTFQGQKVNDDPAFTPVTATLDVLRHLPSLVGGAHRQAVELAHPSPQNPPSLHREIDALMSGALGVPRMGVDEGPKPHPLLAKPTVQRGLPPTVKTLGEAVTGGLTGTRGARGEQEILRSQERGARADAYAKALQANPTVAGAKEASSLLAGEYPKVRFAGFNDFTPEAQNAMVKAIADHPMLQPFEKKRATSAITKIVNGHVPAKNEERLLRTVFGHDTTSYLMQSVSKFRQLKALGYDVLNSPRSVMASFDASGILRQALMIGTGHPGVWAKNVPEYFKAMKSEEVYNTGMRALHQRPNALNGVYEKMGVDLTELTPPGSSAGAREEAFRSPLAEKIPGVRMSGRGFTLFLDNARADLADLLYKKAEQQGRDVNDPHLLESIGDLVNSSSGRGDLGTGVIGRSQEGLNLLLFSPRLIKSRVDFLNPVWYAKLDPLARHEAYKAMGGLVVLVATVLGVGKAAGASVNLDPRSSDFAKVKIGNTRLDFGGGFQQYIRLLSEIASQQVVNSSGKVTNLGQEGPGKTSDWDVVFRFVRSKLAPLASAGVDVSQRQNSIGQPLTFNNSVVSRLTPLSGQDAVSVGQDAANATGSAPGGVAAGLGAFLLSGIGGGVQNYTPKQPKSTGKTGYGARTGGGSSYGRRSGGGSAYGSRP